jgi:biopolymer transport protein ExbD
MGLMLRAAGAHEDAVTSEINTTPLVDVMLVLLIIFLITIPVAIQTVPLELPKQRSVMRQTAPENIELSVDSAGAIYWNAQPVANHEQLLARLKEVAVLQPQPAIQIRGDTKARYEAVGRVLLACQRAAIAKVSFVTEPAAKS